MGEFIVEADGGSRGNPGPAGYGAVVSDGATGETLAEAAEYLGVATNNVAEYRGLLAGLRAAHALDPGARVHVRMDSKLVVEQMSGRWKIKHPAMKPLAAEASGIFPKGRVTYEWIPRAENKHADRLANEAMDAGKRGEQWTPSASRASLDTPAARPLTPEPSGPPGDAKAGAARARAALASATPPAPAADEPHTATNPARRAADGTGGAAEDVVGTRAAGAGVGPGPATGPARRAAEERAADATGGATEDVADTGVGPGTATGPARRAAEERAADATGGAAEDVADTGVGPGTATNPARRAAAAAPEAVGEAPAADAGAGAVRPPGRTRGRADADLRAAQAVATPGAGWAAPDMGPPATFVLLRHGETPLTPQKRFSGSGGSDPSLSGIGREQAERAGEFLARRGTVEAVVSSPLARTRETARIVAARLGLDVAVDDGLRETDFGAWEGLTFGEVRERHPDDLSAWLSSPDAEPTGGGESFAATATRIAATRDRLTAAYAGRTVLLVTHVTPIKTLIRLALGAPPESLFRMELSAASLSAVAYYADGNASVRLFNETSHLR
ncbi:MULTISPECIES: bifunctional RNase H/acid phosphatase [Streptomyces]|uniref:Bifunctional RNase H/acid phosphatase n=1 Tax=Streptomyces edwardsiae TaxID=3075527 RepID=A0ABU2Q2S2_9ACTN|nr:bifunctional RNase H/acid phosphatase [Streptomyces sp. DSM 41636]MDT0398726.1 bifunctional RNase H/acid phosphatase [Streptomyces sp. DSM 41636]